MTNKKICAALISTACLLCSATAAADAHPTVTDLAWMTGSWAGPVGEQTLEENWTQPASGTIASLVRMTRADATDMVELIVIEEENQSLVLRLQQWNPGYKPRTPGPQTLALQSLGDRSVTFTGTGDTGLRTLTYSSPVDGQFNVDVELAEGQKFAVVMAPNTP